MGTGVISACTRAKPRANWKPLRRYVRKGAPLAAADGVGPELDTPILRSLLRQPGGVKICVFPASA
jgi:hypothetical protein